MFVKHFNNQTTYLNLNCSPSSFASFGAMSNIPDTGNGWPP